MSVHRRHDAETELRDFFEFSCRWCGHGGVVAIHATGAAVRRSSILASETRRELVSEEASEAAQHAAMAHAYRQLELMRCRACRRRGPKWSNYIWLRMLGVLGSLGLSAFLVLFVLEEVRRAEPWHFAGAAAPFVVLTLIVLAQLQRDVWRARITHVDE